MESIKGKVILITGANRGIGKSLVKASLEKGAKKVYATTRDRANFPNFGSEKVIPLELDITDKKQIEEVLAQTKDVEVLINNAGVLNPGNILEGETSAFEKDMKINFYGTVDMMRAFAPVLEQNAPARIVNIVSIVAHSPLPTIAGYSASKSALLSATHSVRIELAKKGVTVHAVNPGAIDTDMNKGSEWDMPAPDGVAQIILNKVESEELDIVPDEMGVGMFNAWKEEPAKLAGMFSDMYHQQ